jgi:tRNA-specific adenosine deaminase 1
LNEVTNVDEDIDCLPAKRLKQDDDIHRTGARCVPNSEIQDPKESGLNYHALGALRTKPGRGDPTISMSCSDKLSKWLVVGIQGALLSNLLMKPIHLDGIIISK